MKVEKFGGFLWTRKGTMKFNVPRDKNVKKYFLFIFKTY